MLPVLVWDEQLHAERDSLLAYLCFTGYLLVIIAYFFIKNKSIIYSPLFEVITTYTQATY